MKTIGFQTRDVWINTSRRCAPLNVHAFGGNRFARTYNMRRLIHTRPLNVVDFAHDYRLTYHKTLPTDQTRLSLYTRRMQAQSKSSCDDITHVVCGDVTCYQRRAHRGEQR